MESIPRGIKYLILGGTTVICYPMYYLAVCPPYKRERLHPTRTAVVTGATGKLGTAVSFQLARRKVRVIMACRDLDKCKLIRREIVLHAKSNNIVCKHLDLEDIDSINRFADDLIKNEPHVDILINNAAITDAPVKELTRYGIEKTYFVNFLAPYLLTFRLLDKLKDAATKTLDSRVVNIIGYPRKSWKIDLNDVNFDQRKYSSRAAYQQSKLALAYFTILLEKYNTEQRNNVFAYGVNPIVKRVVNPLNRPTNLVENLIACKENYLGCSAERTVGVIAKAALEPNICDRRESGKLFSYFHFHFGWGKADKNEDEAKQVWNLASKQLLEATDKPKSDTTNNSDNKVEEK